MEEGGVRRTDHWIEGALTINLSLAPPKALGWPVAKRPFLLATPEQCLVSSLTCTLLSDGGLQRGERGRGANVWILSPDFQSVVFCSQ